MDHASRALFEMINKEPTMIALLGAGCSAVSERIAEDSKTWNLITVSISATVLITAVCFIARTLIALSSTYESF